MGTCPGLEEVVGGKVELVMVNCPKGCVLDTDPIRICIGIQIEVRSVSVSKGLIAAMLDAMSFPARAGSARAGLHLRLRIRCVRGCGLGPGCPSVGGYPYRSTKNIRT